MDQLKRMAVFAEVVAAGSLTGAARRLGMTPSAVSQHLRQLEGALGLALAVACDWRVLAEDAFVSLVS